MANRSSSIVPPPAPAPGVAGAAGRTAAAATTARSSDRQPAASATIRRFPRRFPTLTSPTIVSQVARRSQLVKPRAARNIPRVSLDERFAEVDHWLAIAPAAQGLLSVATERGNRTY